MVEALSSIFTAFGLSTSAGLNAYIPLLTVALAARYTDWIELAPPFDVLTSPWVIAVLVVLLLIEVLADKIPVVDHANDVIQTVVRPAAGAILFAASGNVIAEIHPVLAVICGILLAGGVHAVKATARPLVTATTGGLGNPVVSTVEDVVAVVVSIVSILLPILTGIALLIIGWVIFRRWQRRRTQSAPA